MPAPATRHLLLDPKNDYVFKRLLADSPELLSSLINAVRHDRPPVEVEEVLNPAILPEEMGDKAIVLDVLARDANGRRFNVEMQARRDPDWAARSVFYMARALGRQLSQGEHYERLRAAVGVHLLDFDLFDDPTRACWRFELRDQWQPAISLGDDLELNILELPKAQVLGNLPKATLAWVTFFERWNEEMAMTLIDDPAVREARRKLEELSQDDQEWARAWLRDKGRDRAASLEHWARVEERKKGLEEGRAEGRAAGLVVGEAQMLQRLLVRRFGALPEDIVERLRAADAKTLERWADRLIDGATLAQVLGER